MPPNSHPFHMKSSRHSIELANADISRLMDPSYHPSNNHGVSSTEPARVYIDRRGQMHDPDFHYFPVYEGAGKNNKRGRRVSDPWDRSKIQYGDEDLEEDDDNEERPTQYHRRQSTRRPRSSQSHAYPISSSDSYTSSIPSSSSTSSSPSSITSHLPYSSYSSVFEDKPRHHHHHSILPKKFRRHSSDSSSPPSPLSLDALEFDDVSDVEDVEEDHESPIEEQDLSSHQQTALSYSQAMKKQWLAVSLSLRFRLFRARRRASSSYCSKRS
ncbi:hypothetical protein EV359DRAFT_81266 [Lentinula novae-zelandiae]|nr:hypothetical protein EV359DRAFT_81266 [Lentinula novae-zelandiae]